MHADEVDTDPSLVRRLLASQFPEWADLPSEPVDSAGTVHALYRLRRADGDDLVVRLPRVEGGAAQAAVEAQWLPRFVAHLPLALPEPVAHGAPAEGYPYPWSIYRWLPGQEATLDRLTDPDEAAHALAAFVSAMQRLPFEGGPTPGSGNSYRGNPLPARDAVTRRCIAECAANPATAVDTDAATVAWTTALEVPAYEGRPIWLHGDLLPGNLLAVDGRLSAVIDWGCLSTGDPAYDLLPAWALLPPGARETFRDALDVDDATWARGRGWSLSWALVALPYYVDTNPRFAALARHTIEAVLSDHAIDR
jgi:aminoglycoside phosphotransferase (APT) family kinase protein